MTDFRAVSCTGPVSPHIKYSTLQERHSDERLKDIGTICGVPKPHPKSQPLGPVGRQNLIRCNRPSDYGCWQVGVAPCLRALVAQQY